MKSLIKQILLILALIAIIYECHGREIRKERLSRIYSTMLIKSKRTDKNDVINGMDYNCVKNFFKLPQNGDMIMTEMETPVFMIAALLKCSDENKAFEYVLNQFVRRHIKEELPCLQLFLKTVEPESKLIENFKISKNDADKCNEDAILDSMVEQQKIFEEDIGPLNVYTCGVFDGANDFLKFLAKSAIIRFGDINDELKSSEMKKVKDYFLSTMFSVINCVFKRFEDDPTAYFINDTLSYYFKQDSVPTDPNEEDPNGYNKRLLKVEETIDNN
ncbi:balbiani ring A 67 kDa protein-like [Chironomus tepperi]|uniref:balbiani ring A 67 kDa protein-like n=1 Tax=Chironomus tepperi TaxID=113505 RepID=UPI00391F202C